MVNKNDKTTWKWFQQSHQIVPKFVVVEEPILSTINKFFLLVSNSISQFPFIQYYLFWMFLSTFTSGWTWTYFFFSKPKKVTFSTFTPTSFNFLYFGLYPIKIISFLDTLAIKGGGGGSFVGNLSKLGGVWFINFHNSYLCFHYS